LVKGQMLRGRPLFHFLHPDRLNDLYFQVMS
jgi:hypothetical protein